MKKICGGEAVSLLPVTKGVIILEKHILKNEKIAVKYKLYSTESHRLSAISKTDFLLYKFGGYFEKIVDKLTGVLSCKTVFLPDGRLLVVYPSGEAGLFNPRGEMVREFSMKYKDSQPNDVVFFNNAIWAVFANENALVKYSTATVAQQFRFGGTEPPCSFNRPIGICGDKENLYITNAQTNKISIFHPDSFSLTDYADFSEPLHQYLRINGCEVILLESGVYKV